MSYVEPATLEPDTEIDALRTADGEMVRFGGDERARYEPPDVVVRDDAGVELRRFADHQVSAVYDRRLDVAPTIAGIAIGAAILAAVIVNMEDYDQTPEEGMN